MSYFCPCFVGLAATVVAVSAGAPGEQPAPAQILRFVEGVDAAVVPMAPSDIAAQLNDPWATLVLRKDTFPTDLTKTLAALDPPPGQVGHSVQQSFFVSESGQLPVEAKLAREIRVVITRAEPNDSLPDVLISAPAGQREGFIELMSWDPIKKAFNFYRRPAGGNWTWKGDTRDAFNKATAGKGCFECHVHGAPIMKELRVPWNNWSSQSASLAPEAIPAPDLRKSPLFTKKSGAEDLEPIVRGWESRALTELVKDRMKKDSFPSAPLLLRPLFVTDTANLQSSKQLSKGTSTTVDLPAGLYLNFDALSNVLGLETLPNFSGVVERSLYAAALQKYALELSDGNGFTQKGDTFFGFLVPTPAESGTALIRQLIAQQVVTRQFVLCVLLVDFQNPVYSSSRSGLFNYVPATAHVEDGRSDLADKTALAIVTAAPKTAENSPERQFAANWAKAPNQLRADAEKQIKDYQNAVILRLKTQDGVNDYTRLAESRRRRFGTTALNEFPLLLPKTNLPANLDLRMNADGTVSP